MSVPAIVERAAQVAHNDHAGIVGYRVEQTSQIDGGPIHRYARVVLVAAYENDKLIRVRVLKYVDNGKDAGDAARRELEAQLTKSGEGFAVPFDARHFGEYAYDSPDGRTVRFTSGMRDQHHGEGQFTVGDGGHVTALSYRPFALPDHATSGTIDEKRAEVLPGFWATIHSAQHYIGRYLLIHGSAEIVTTESQFVRYTTRTEAETAIRDATL